MLPWSKPSVVDAVTCLEEVVLVPQVVVQVAQVVRQALEVNIREKVEEREDLHQDLRQVRQLWELQRILLEDEVVSVSM